VKVVIPSRRRSQTIGSDSLRLFPDAYVVVHESERDDYRKVVTKRGRLLTHDVAGLGTILNWIVDNVADRHAIAILADDTTGFYLMPGWSARRVDEPERIMAIIESTAQCAIDAGCGLFGGAQNPNPVQYEPGRPIKLARWVGGPLGMVTGHGLRFDERLSLHVDVDLSLQSLLKHRIIWCDARWCTSGRALSNEGGSAHLRGHDAFEREQAILKEKWGPYIEFDMVASKSSLRYAQGLPAMTKQTYVYVPRTQPGF
jgi:hypothetical protein